MLRLVLIAAVSSVLAVACAPKEEAPPPAAEVPAGSQAAPVSDPASAPTPAAPAPETRMGTMQVSCGGESFRVAFEDTRAVVVNADGSNTELTRLEPQPGAPAGVVTYTNGMMTFTKEGGKDTATVVKYARGRMAFQDCAIAQN